MCLLENKSMRTLITTDHYSNILQTHHSCSYIH